MSFLDRAMPSYSVPGGPGVDNRYTRRLEGAGVTGGDRKAVRGRDGRDVTIRCGKTLASIARRNGEVGIAASGIRIKGKDSAVEQAEKPVEGCGELALALPVRQRADAEQEFRDGDAGEIEGCGGLLVQPGAHGGSRFRLHRLGNGALTQFWWSEAYPAPMTRA